MFDITDNAMLAEQNANWSLPDVTIPAELPPPTTFGVVDNTVQHVASGAVNQSSSWGDFLKPVVATGQSLLNVWGQLQGLEAQKTQMETQRAVTIGDMAVRSAQADSAAEIAKLQASTMVAVEKARAEGAIAKAQGEAQAAKTGAVYIPAVSSLSMPVLLGIGAIGLAFFAARNKAK
jgi:hypothetical protein